eukprot:CAMPEP_0194204890 /NCGR_PEP_ID=MMETSP0156-20130528/4298_1 /TAXON_ID=33649 /ORGANISM="Thalassionema nitzschioides, Strain L26-B" /LENGTH=137 /DNA_ID=CAMNT_0038931017 /DNA_START=143 /DNA_END=556 /DNA_ORIENTATION=-
MDTIDFWHSYDFSKGFDAAIYGLYAPNAKITFSSSSGTVTLSAEEFYQQTPLCSKLRIRTIQNLDCAGDGAWCHLKIYTTYWNAAQETVSIPQYWTYLYDPVTCKSAHQVILTHSNDLEYLTDFLTTTEIDSPGDEF